MLRIATPLSLALLLTACPDKPGVTDSDSQGSSGATGTTVVEPTTSASGETGSGGVATEGMSESTATSESTTAGPATSTGSETGGEVDIGTACTAACEHIFECVKGLPGTVADCRAGCIDEWGAPRCGQVGVDLLQCMAGMTCQQLKAYVDDDEAGVCAEAEAAAEVVCGGASGCVLGGGAGGGECSVSRDCGGSVQELRCDGQTCTCVSDGEPGEGCPDMGVCGLDFDGQVAASEVCCGWDWS